jgi:hypothetical protein
MEITSPLLWFILILTYLIYININTKFCQKYIDLRNSDEFQVNLLHHFYIR